MFPRGSFSPTEAGYTRAGSSKHMKLFLCTKELPISARTGRSIFCTRTTFLSLIPAEGITAFACRRSTFLFRGFTSKLHATDIKIFRSIFMHQIPQCRKRCSRSACTLRILPDTTRSAPTCTRRFTSKR